MHFAMLSSRAPQQMAYDHAKSRLESAEVALSLPPPALLAGRIAADPHDLSARLSLANVHIARRAYGPALEQLLEIARRDRKFGRDIARLKMLDVFVIAADQAELVAEYRRRLSAILF
jgi:putative thioredoxin